jgi:hypothetical protein
VWWDLSPRSTERRSIIEASTKESGGKQAGPEIGQTPDRTSHQTPVTAVAPVHRVQCTDTVPRCSRSRSSTSCTQVQHITSHWIEALFEGIESSFPSVEGCPIPHPLNNHIGHHVTTTRPARPARHHGPRPIHPGRWYGPRLLVPYHPNPSHTLALVLLPEQKFFLVAYRRVTRASIACSTLRPCVGSGSLPSISHFPIIWFGSAGALGTSVPRIRSLGLGFGFGQRYLWSPSPPHPLTPSRPLTLEPPHPRALALSPYLPDVTSRNGDRQLDRPQSPDDE